MRIVLAALLFLAVPIALGELAPEVYLALQRDAPELVQLEIVDVEIDRELKKPRGCGFFEFEVVRHVTAKAKVMKVIRSRSGVKPGATIEVRYVSLKQCEGWTGARPIPLLDEDTRVYAWLVYTGRRFAPAARGASFAAELPR